MLIYEELTGEIIAAAIEVHRILGPGLLESAYRIALCHELRLRGYECRMEVDVQLDFKGVLLGTIYRIDILVEEKVIVEVKSVLRMIPIFEAQMLTHMRLKEIKVGLLINFNVAVLKDGITRRVL